MRLIKANGTASDATRVDGVALPRRGVMSSFRDAHRRVRLDVGLDGQSFIDELAALRR